MELQLCKNETKKKKKGRLHLQLVVPAIRAVCWHRYEKIEEAKKEMRKKAELEKRFEKNGDAGADSDDSDMEDEDKIAEQEEAGETCAANALQ